MPSSFSVAAGESVQRGAAPHVTISQLGLKRGDRWLFRNLSWEAPKGAFIAVVGPSGAGKSSLLGCLAGTLLPTEGKVAYALREEEPRHPGDCHRDIGMVFQNLALSANSSVLSNVLCGRLGRRHWWSTLFGFSRGEREEAFAMLADLNLDRYAHRPVRQLSGGEQQRTAILRALFQQPEVLLADEPVSNLDAYLCGRVLGLLRAEAHQAGRTVFCVLHDSSLVDRFADYVLSIDPTDAERWAVRRVRGSGGQGS